MKTRIVDSRAQLRELEAHVLSAAVATMDAIAARQRAQPGLEVFAALRFTECGRDPLDPVRSLNFVEQLNQTFTYLATIQAAHWLFEHFPEHAPFRLNLGTAPGSDIESLDGAISAETFAATHPDSNRKLDHDVAKVTRSSAVRRFVFYLSPVAAKERTDPDVAIVRLDHPTLVD